MVTELTDSNEEELPELGVDELLEALDSDKEPEGGLLWSVYQVLKKRQHPPRKKYFFPISHQETKMGKPLPSPCKVCSSWKHWDRECPYWDKYLEKVKLRNTQIAALQVPPEASPDEAYQATYQALVIEANKDLVDGDNQSSVEPSGFQMVSQTSQGSESSMAIESKTNKENEIGEIKFTLIGSLHRNDELCKSENTEKTNTSKVYLASLPRPTDIKPIKLNPKWKTKEEVSAAEISVLAIEGWVGNLRNKRIYLQHDSCVDISLISDKYYNSLKDPPPIRRGTKLKLWQLTNKNTEIEGYV